MFQMTKSAAFPEASVPRTLEPAAVVAPQAELKVFLTASPIQLGSDNLFVLLNMLRPDVVIDRTTFEDMAGCAALADILDGARDNGPIKPVPDLNCRVHSERQPRRC